MKREVTYYLSFVRIKYLDGLVNFILYLPLAKKIEFIEIYIFATFEIFYFSKKLPLFELKKTK